MDRHEDHPWFSADLIRLRARQRRWLYGVTHILGAEPAKQNRYP